MIHFAEALRIETKQWICTETGLCRYGRTEPSVWLGDPGFFEPLSDTREVVFVKELQEGKRIEQCLTYEHKF